MSELVPHYDEEDKRLVKETMLQCIDKWLPQIAEEITPIILQKTKELVKQNILMKINSNIDKQNALSEGLIIMERNPNLWRGLLHRRADCYSKLARVASLLTLYKEGLLEVPIYVPYKFRQDETYVKSQDVLEQMYKMNVQRLQSEITTLEIKLDDMRKEINNVDAEILHEVRHLSSDETVINVIKRDIKEKVLKDTIRINEECETKAQIRRQKYKEDQRKYLKRNKQPRFLDTGAVILRQSNATKAQETIGLFKEEHRDYQERTYCLLYPDVFSSAPDMNGYMEHSNTRLKKACATGTQVNRERYAENLRNDEERSHHLRCPDVVYPITDVKLTMKNNSRRSNSTRAMETRVQREFFEEELHKYDGKQILLRPDDIPTDDLREENLMFIPYCVITNENVAEVNNEVIQNRNMRCPFGYVTSLQEE